jgi:hypothetical protein
MDPNETLSQIRAKLADLETPLDDSDDAWNIVQEITELFCGLDDWLKNGGFLPSDWAENWVAIFPIDNDRKAG